MKNYICEQCGNDHDGSYGSGRFCSKECQAAYAGSKVKHRPTANDLKLRKGFGKKRSPYGTWKCDDCNIIFGTKAELIEHKHLVHDLPYGKGKWSKGLTKETNESIRRASEKNTGRKNPNKGRPGRKWTQEQRNAMSENRKMYYKNHPEKHPARLLANNRNHMTYPEKVTYDWLVKNNIEFKHQFKFEFNNKVRYVDFYIPNQKIFIEIDGEFWHKDRKQIDLEKDQSAEQIGIKTLRIPAKENIEQILSNFFNIKR